MDTFRATFGKHRLLFTPTSSHTDCLNNSTLVNNDRKFTSTYVEVESETRYIDFVMEQYCLDATSVISTGNDALEGNELSTSQSRINKDNF